MASLDPSPLHRETTTSSSASSKSCSSITQMDEDQIISILQLLPCESIISFSMTCRKFRSLASSDSFWKFICKRDWGLLSSSDSDPDPDYYYSLDALALSLSSSSSSSSSSFQSQTAGAGGSFSWKRLYKEVSQLTSLSCRSCSLTTSTILSQEDDDDAGADGFMFPMPSPRASHSLNFVSDSNCLVLFGGGSEGGRHLDDTWVAHVRGNQYHRLSSWKKVHSGTPSGRFGQSCTNFGNTLILFGGINDNGVRLNDTWIGNAIYESSPEIVIKWRLLENAGLVAPPPRGAHAACLAGNHHRILVIHGGIGHYGLRLSDTWLLDLSNGLHSARWQQVVYGRPSPSARSGHSLTWIGETRMVLFGGRGSGYEVLNDLWVLDLEAERGRPKWTELKYDHLSNITEMPRPRVGHSANLILGGKILIYGGEDSHRQRKDDFWMLDINAMLKTHAVMGRKKASAGRMWKKLRVVEGSPGYRSFHGACTDKSGRYVYIFGGMVDGVLQPGEASGLRFDGELFVVELVLQL